jgi:hypothetical protein
LAFAALPLSTQIEGVTAKKSWEIQRAIRIRKSEKDRQHNIKKKKGQSTIYNALHRKLKLEQHVPYYIG